MRVRGGPKSPTRPFSAPLMCRRKVESRINAYASVSSSRIVVARSTVMVRCEYSLRTKNFVSTKTTIMARLIGIVRFVIARLYCVLKGLLVQRDKGKQANYLQKRKKN